MKKCPTCKVSKTLDGFYKNRSRHDGVEPYCIPCSKARIRADKPKAQHRALMRNYGIGLKDYNKMSLEQGHVCYICGFKPKENLAVDHCHTSGKVRGLLCKPCNMGLGNFRDDVHALQAAIAYLSR